MVGSLVGQVAVVTGASSGIGAASALAGAVLLRCTQSAGSRIIEIQMRTMSEALT